MLGDDLIHCGKLNALGQPVHQAIEYSVMLVENPVQETGPQGSPRETKQKKSHIALIAGASTPDPSTSVNSESNNSRPIPKFAFTQEDAGAHVLLKVDGKKRVVDEDDDATATKRESPLVEGPAKKRKSKTNGKYLQSYLH
ncbi:hypothetical protein BYT27DRAFT_7219662 [Phlegmacium glaucopus]|nr:hypothetical protein BYT27DRAFT_7219662 [Phlegmacium glaucopus]